jgi:site-specific recombinase XerD
MPRKTFKKIITSPELIEQINPENKKLVNKFLKNKNAKCSDKTIAGYTSDLNIYFCYNLIENNNKFFIETKKIEISEFFDYGLMELKWSSNRYSRVRSLMSSFSDFIVDYLDEDYPDFKSLINKAVPKIPKIPVRKKTVVLPEQVYQLRDHLISKNKLQQATYLMLLASSGARISESLRITTDLIDENHTAFDDLFLETTDEIKTKGHGKNGFMMTRFLIKDVFLPIYKQWLPVREEIMKRNNKEHNAMFIKSNGEPIKESTVRSWLLYWEKFLNAPSYAHMFRHFIVSDLTRKGCSSDFIVAVMKWKSGTAMFNIYNDIEDKDRKWKEVEKLKGIFDNQNTQFSESVEDIMKKLEDTDDESENI